MQREGDLACNRVGSVPKNSLLFGRCLLEEALLFINYLKSYKEVKLNTLKK